MTSDVRPTRLGWLRAAFRAAWRERPFQLLYAEVAGFLSFFGSPILYFCIPSDVLIKFTTVSTKVPDEFIFVAGFCFVITGMLGCGLIGAWLAFLAAELTTRIAQREPKWASTLMFVVLILPFTIFVPAIWILNERTGQRQAIALLILSLLFSGVLTFAFRMSGWPGPMSEKSGREQWREYWEARRRQRG